MATNVVQVLEQHNQVIESQIADLVDQKDAINKVIEGFRTTSSGFGVHTGGKLGVYKMTTSVSPKGRKSAMSSMDMARQVLNNNGGKKGAEMSAKEIIAHVKDTFGVEPATSLTQMLYKRSRAKSSFYRTKAGKYGLLDWTTSTKKAA
jgi:hypothetical protein